MTEGRFRVIGGVDTHGRTHHAVVLSTTGGVLASAEFAASATGYRRLLTWIRECGEPVCVGVEGTGTYGAGWHDTC